MLRGVDLAEATRLAVGICREHGADGGPTCLPSGASSAPVERAPQSAPGTPVAVS